MNTHIYILQKNYINSYLNLYLHFFKNVSNKKITFFKRVNNKKNYINPYLYLVMEV